MQEGNSRAQTVSPLNPFVFYEISFCEIPFYKILSPLSDGFHDGGRAMAVRS